MLQLLLAVFQCVCLVICVFLVIFPAFLLRRVSTLKLVRLSLKLVHLSLKPIRLPLKPIRLPLKLVRLPLSALCLILLAVWCMLRSLAIAASDLLENCFIEAHRFPFTEHHFRQPVKQPQKLLENRHVLSEVSRTQERSHDFGHFLLGERSDGFGTVLAEKRLELPEGLGDHCRDYALIIVFGERRVELGLRKLVESKLESVAFAHEGFGDQAFFLVPELLLLVRERGFEESVLLEGFGDFSGGRRGFVEDELEGRVLVEDFMHEGDSPFEGTVGHNLLEQHHGLAQFLGHKRVTASVGSYFCLWAKGRASSLVSSCCTASSSFFIRFSISIGCGMLAAISLFYPFWYIFITAAPSLHSILKLV